ncbi:MAG: alpha-ketoglutarate-dependent dioxygenase AlkB [Acidobacteriota bacterium]|nr:alpha-ketoglutarate-dependent dioxygenase AlkB [Acidobacteriota bacterium]
MTTLLFSDGAQLLEDFIDRAEETAWLEAIDAGDWSHEIGRRVQHYGFRYDYSRRTAGRAAPAAPFPAWARAAAARLEEHFGGATSEQCIVNEYLPGQGIGMHADADAFGPVVVSISLAADWPMRFRPRYGQAYSRDGLPGDKVVTLPARSALVLTGAARTRWMHGIDRRDTAGERHRRVSATFRTLA